MVREAPRWACSGLSLVSRSVREVRMAASDESHVSSVPPEGVLKIGPDESVGEAARRMQRHHVGSLVVTDETGRMVGMITERDLIDGALAVSPELEGPRVSEVMTTDVVSVGPDTPAIAIGRIMASHAIRHLPIIDDAEVVGIVSARDILARQLQVAKALKAAAEMVALLGKSLRRLDIEELVEMLSNKIPETFGAKRWVLYMPGESAARAGRPASHRNRCPCSDEELARRAEPAEGGTSRVVACEALPDTCREAGCDGCQAVIPLDVAGPALRAWASPDQDASYLCMCGLPGLTEDARDVLRYKLELIADILSVNLLNGRLYRAAYRDPLTDLRARRSIGPASNMGDKEYDYQKDHQDR